MKSSANRSQATATRHPQHKNLPLPLVIFIDFLLIGAGLIVFALFHHVLPRDVQLTGQSLPRPTTLVTAASTTDGSQATATTGSESPSETVATTAVHGLWGVRFADKFTSGDIIRTDTSYRSENIAISIEMVSADSVTYYVADIYLRDIEYFRTAFAGGVYARGSSDEVLDMAVENNAVLAISGDYYGIRDQGVVIRNGELYREKTFQDVLVMNYDGSLQTFTESEFDIDAVKANGAWQAWSFGPMLLDEGQVMTEFNSEVTPRNPRGAIGYYEPGHYCFVLVDGRQEGYSIGMTLKQMSQLFYVLGCQAAYNLDGGQSATMVFTGEIVNQPYNGGRKISDIIYIGE